MLQSGHVELKVLYSETPVFTSLLLLFSLTETGQPQAAPLVTIPTR